MILGLDFWEANEANINLSDHSITLKIPSLRPFPDTTLPLCPETLISHLKARPLHEPDPEITVPSRSAINVPNHPALTPFTNPETERNDETKENCEFQLSVCRTITILAGHAINVQLRCHATEDQAQRHTFIARPNHALINDKNLTFPICLAEESHGLADLPVKNNTNHRIPLPKGMKVGTGETLPEDLKATLIASLTVPPNAPHEPMHPAAPPNFALHRKSPR